VNATVSFFYARPQSKHGSLITLIKTLGEDPVPASGFLCGDGLYFFRIAGSNDERGSGFCERCCEAATEKSCGSGKQNGMVLEGETGEHAGLFFV
jgi:hypothetical protein